MVLDRVTITGADDRTDPKALAALSREFPFVEWGILLGSGTGPRFPTSDWIARLGELHASAPMRLSAHLCGRLVREVLADAPGRIAPPACFGRVQLNFHALPHQVNASMLAAIVNADARPWIFQLDGANDHIYLNIRRLAHAAVPLFDQSGGAGVLPKRWPTAWPETYCGYAGGLGADNVIEQLIIIGQRMDPDARIWIDMERRVRSDDDRDLRLDLVARVLELCRPLIG